MKTHVRQVTESANGQKTVTVPKNSDIEDGDYIKFRRTERWETDEIEEAVNKALDELDEEMSFDDPLKPDGVRDYTYLCGYQAESVREPCLLDFPTEDKLCQHFEDVHEDVEFDPDEHIIELVKVQRMFLRQLVKKAICHLDLENSETTSD